MAGQLKLQVPQGDPLRLPAETEGGPEAGQPGGKGHGLVPEGGGYGALPRQNAPSPLGGEPGQCLKVGQGMLQPAAHAAQQDEPAVSPVQTLPQGVDHIGVILGNRELHHVGVVGPTTQRVKVAHHQIGRHAIGLQRLIALVGGDEKILRPRVRAQRPGQGIAPTT